jgi:hypothetical protein
MVALHLFVLHWRAGGIHIVKGKGSGWLRWLLKQGGVILAHPTHRENRCALELPFGKYDYSPSMQGSSTSHRGKQKQIAPLCLLVPVT